MSRKPASPVVAMDATLWDDPTTGIGLYTRQLVEALRARGAQVDRYGARVSGEFPRGNVSRTAYFLSALPAALRANAPGLFHGVSNFTLPLQRLQRTRMVLTVHDLIPEVLPEAVSTKFRWQFRVWLTRSLLVADRVICDSERTRKDLLARYELNPEKASVVHLGADHVDGLGHPDAPGVRAFFDHTPLPERYVLYAGSLDTRKNIAVLLDALERLETDQRRLPLVLIGQSWFGSAVAEKRIEKMKARGHDIRVLGYQPEEIFYAVIRRATLFVFPSRYEGFGLPPLEAMRLGVPTLISTEGALPEVCGEGARRADARVPEAWAEAIWQLWQTPSERQALAQAGSRRAQTLTWASTAEKTERIYREAAGEGAG